jgi:PrcB C-terminal
LLIPVGAILAVLPLAAFAAMQVPGPSIPFTSLARGMVSGITQPDEVVVTSPAEWQTLWSRHAPAAPLPGVDFTTDMVVGVFAGERRTGGYGVQILGIERGAGDAVVGYRITEPGRDAMVTQMLTSPFHLVRLPRQGVPFRFERR